MLFVDTADMLARMSRETLVKARWVKLKTSLEYMYLRYNVIIYRHVYFESHSEFPGHYM